MKACLITLLLTSLPFSGIAQEHEHIHARNEIGISPGATYSPSHKSWGLGIHAHYFRTLSDHSPWALGGSLEQVFLHGNHWTIGAGARYEIFERLNISVMPGITFFSHNEEHNHAAHGENDSHPSSVQFSTHFEIAYDLIELEHFHFGPAIDYSWSNHDSHFMFGIHCAYGF